MVFKQAICYTIFGVCANEISDWPIAARTKKQD